MNRLPIGTRVRIKAGPAEGSDAMHNGQTGTIEGGDQWACVRLDNPRGWSNPALICWHNLRVIKK